MKKIVSAPYIDQTARWVNGREHQQRDAAAGRGHPH